MRSRQFRFVRVPARFAALLLALPLILSGCGVAPIADAPAPTATPPAQVASAPTATPARATPTPVPADPTATPGPTPRPSADARPAPTLAVIARIPSPTPEQAQPTATPPTPDDDPAVAIYTAPDGSWSVAYPPDLLHVEDLGNGTTIFISEDRGTFAAVDTYTADGNAYGNTGEDLRNRARDTLARIYGRSVDEQDVLAADGVWETGITFTTAKGSKGVAAYEQRGRDQGDLRVFGFVWGYKANIESAALPLLEAMRQTFTR